MANLEDDIFNMLKQVIDLPDGITELTLKLKHNEIPTIEITQEILIGAGRMTHFEHEKKKYEITEID